jgi:hypothetical protein
MFRIVNTRVTDRSGDIVSVVYRRSRFRKVVEKNIWTESPNLFGTSVSVLCRSWPSESTCVPSRKSIPVPKYSISRSISESEYVRMTCSSQTIEGKSWNLKWLRMGKFPYGIYVFGCMAQNVKVTDEWRIAKGLERRYSAHCPEWQESQEGHNTGPEYYAVSVCLAISYHPPPKWQPCRFFQ